MKNDYEKCIDFCKAEIVTGKTHWVEVRETTTAYTIVFLCLHHSVDILKPHKAEEQDALEKNLFGYIATPYKELPIWADLVGMLGLKSDWVSCADRLPEEDGDYLVHFKKGGISQASFVGGKWSITIQFQNISRTHDAEVSHWQPLPTKP